MNWRVGRKVPLNVYEDDRPVCQCHNEEDATEIVRAVNFVAWLRERAPATFRTWQTQCEAQQLDSEADVT